MGKPVWKLPGWPNFVADQPGVTAAVLRARALQGKLMDKLATPRGEEFDSLAREIFLQEVLASATIEGLTPDPICVMYAVARKFEMAWPLADGPSSQLAEGLVTVLHDATQGFERPLDENRLFQWRSALKPSRATRRNGGVAERYRTTVLGIVSGQTSREIVHYIAPPATQVEAEMNVFLDWFARTTPAKSCGFSVDGVTRAAIAHLWLESIQPFVECNGLIARAVATMAMAQDTSTPALLCNLSSQFLQSIDEYQNALNSARHDRMDASSWVEWAADAMGRSCLASCALLDNISSEKSQFWVKHSQLDLNARQRKILQVLLANGDGGSLGGLNAAKYRIITGASKPTATRDLADLVRHGLLGTQGIRKALRYYICVPGWTHGFHLKESNPL